MYRKAANYLTVDMVNVGHGALTQPSDMPPQPGLGTFSKLPLELRRVIWQYLLPGFGGAQGLGCHCPASEPCCTGACTPTLPTRHRSDLTVLRTSKDVFYEVSYELYRNRALTVCFSDQEHWKTFVRTEHQQTDFWLTVDGVCLEKCLGCTDFSKFGSLRITIQFPNEDNGC